MWNGYLDCPNDYCSCDYLYDWACIGTEMASGRCYLVNGQDSAIPKAIEEHPFTLNPIIWVIAVAGIFMFIVIFYYATSSSY